jgi:diacylglycerol kinase family enzyme
VEHCHQRGIDVVILGPGDDLEQLARAAVDAGADVIGMAGGDGSQAGVAGVASERGVAMVVVPAGTRNHLALDLGLGLTAGLIERWCSSSRRASRGG